LNIYVNGKATDVPDGLTLSGLVAQRRLNPDTIIVEHNYNLVQKERWDGIMLKENDRVEILRFVEGG
jgi:sulfur carrier protein